jgi:hypothetical protein
MIVIGRIVTSILSTMKSYVWQEKAASGTHDMIRDRDGLGSNGPCAATLEKVAPIVGPMNAPSCVRP